MQSHARTNQAKDTSTDMYGLGVSDITVMQMLASHSMRMPSRHVGPQHLLAHLGLGYTRHDHGDIELMMKMMMMLIGSLLPTLVR